MKTKIAFIGYSLFAGGAEANIINILPYLTSNGFDPELLLFKNINEYKFQYTKRLKKMHIYSLLNTQRKFSFIERPLMILGLIINAFRKIKKENYKVLVALVEYDPFFLTIFFSVILRKKGILIVGDNLAEDLKRKPLVTRYLYALLFNLSFKLADKIICVSKGLGKNLQDNFHIPKHKIHIIYNGVNVKAIKNKAKTKLSEKYERFMRNHDVIVMLSRLVPKKGHTFVLNTLPSIITLFPRIKLYIIGQGSQYKLLKEKVKHLHLQNYVVFHGFEKTNPYKYIQKARLFLFSSVYEGFGNVLIEAMACGTPVISTNCQYGPKEILLNSKYGILTPSFAENKKAGDYLVNAVQSLLLAKNRRSHYKQMGLKRANDFTATTMSQGYYKVISELLDHEKKD